MVFKIKAKTYLRMFFSFYILFISDFFLCLIRIQDNSKILHSVLVVHAGFGHDHRTILFLTRYPDVDCEQVWLDIAPKYQKRRRPGNLNIFEINGL